MRIPPRALSCFLILPLLSTSPAMGQTKVRRPEGQSGQTEPMVRQLWEERRPTEEISRGIEKALAIPDWDGESATKAASGWRQIGRTIVDSDVSNHDKSGRVRCASWAYDSALGETTLFIGTTSGGLFKLGRNLLFPAFRMWVPLSWNLPGSPSVGAFLVHPLNSNKIIIGTGDRGRGDDVGTGIYRTMDGGASWTKRGMVPQPESVEKIVVDVTDATGNTVVAATQTGVWRSTNFGDSWIRIAPGDPTLGVTDIVQAPSGSPWYLGVPGTGVLKCWALGGLCMIGAGFAEPIFGVSVAVSPSDPEWVFALVAGRKLCSKHPYEACFADGDCAGMDNYCSRQSNGLLNGIYRSGDSGATFVRIEKPGTDEISAGQGFHTSAIAVDPDTPNRLMVGMAGVQMTLNATVTNPEVVCWARNIGSDDNGWCSMPYQIDIGHSDQTSLHFVPDGVDPGNTRILATNDGGVYDYDWAANSLDDWLNEVGPNISQTYGASMARSVSDPDRLLIGTQDNGIIRVDLDQVSPYTYFPTHPNSSSADGGLVSINPGNANQFGAAVGLGYNRYLSTDAGATWNNVDAGLAERWFPAVRFHRKPGYASVFSHDDRYVYYRFPWDDPADSWSYVNPHDPLPAGAAISNVEVARTDTTVIYLTDSRSKENGTAALSVMEEGVTGDDIGNMFWEDRTPTNIGSDPVNEGLVSPGRSAELADYVFFVTGKNRPSRAFLSTDRGKHWFEVTGNLEGVLDDVNFWQLAAHPLDHRQLFLAAETGVYRSDDSGRHWYRYMDGLPEVVKARALEIHSNGRNDTSLVLATWGHGMWEKDVEFIDHIFSDDFETGSTSRWSNTVP